jgi:hypothetical protein
MFKEKEAPWSREVEGRSLEVGIIAGAGDCTVPHPYKRTLTKATNIITASPLLHFLEPRTPLIN